MSSANPFSSGSAIIVSLFLERARERERERGWGRERGRGRGEERGREGDRGGRGEGERRMNKAGVCRSYFRTTLYFLLGVSAKHFSEEVSTTVSQNATTGSDTLISTMREREGMQVHMCCTCSAHAYHMYCT